MEQPLPFDHYKTLYNMLKTYSYEDEQVLVLEAVANSLVAKAKKIRLSKEVNLNADRKRFWLGRIENVDCKIINESILISLNYFEKREI